MSSEKQAPGVKGKFSASDPFPHALPYQQFYAEKIPLLNVFRMVIAEYMRSKANAKHSYGRVIEMVLPFSKRDKFLAAECGVYKGNSLVACAEVAREFAVPFHFYGLDSFEGLPTLSQKDREMAPPNAPYLEQRLFSDTSLEAVGERLKQQGLASYVTLVPGFFRDTLPTLLDKKFWFVSIDCDLYEPHVECLEFFYPRMNRGGVIFFDDYYSVEYPMARSAVDEFLKDKSESLMHLRYGDDKPNHTKAFIVKH